MRVLLMVSASYLPTYPGGGLAFARYVLAEEVSVVWEVTKNPGQDQELRVWLLVEGSAGLKTRKERVDVALRIYQLAAPPSYLEVCAGDGPGVYLTSFGGDLSLEGTPSPERVVELYRHFSWKDYLEWLYDEEPGFEEKLEELLDRGVDPLSPQGLAELDAKLTELKVGILDAGDLERDLYEYVEATVERGEFPIRNSKGEEPRWVGRYRA
jgi:hypothetical protein